MKTFFHYIEFFFYYAINWNPVLAAFVLYHTVKGEKKFGIRTFRASELDRYTIEKGDRSKSSRYEAVNYFILEKLLENFRERYPHEKKLFDAGCGKGRVMVVAAHYGFTRITGIDFARELCAEAEKNIRYTKPLFPKTDFRLICDDVLEYQIPGDENVFFLFNPFDAEILEKFLEKIDASVRLHPRTVYFLYASPRHIDLFSAKKYKVVYHIKKLKYLEGIITVK